MKRIKSLLIISVLLLVLGNQAAAKLSQPDFVLYGTATWFGAPLPTESEVSIYLNSQLLTVAKYSMGTDDNLNGLYALRVPMDSNDPRVFGKARPGDSASVYINGSLVAEVLVGDYGVAERLDIDPINLADDVSVISILPSEVTEGQSGQSEMVFKVQISNDSEEVVSVDWQNIDGDAIGGDNCGFDVDYLNASGRASIPVGATETNVTIQVCGDTLIENSETFEVVLSGAENGVIQFDRATGTILDDDGLPQLQGFDAVVYEPASGTLVHDFELKLSRAYDQVVAVDYVTVARTATPGADFIAASGTISIPVGQTAASIPVTFLSDAEDENIEIMTVQLSNPRQATLVNDVLTAFILDANQDEQTEEGDSINNDDVPDLISPSDVVFSSDSNFVYVSSLNAGGSVLRFALESGNLSYLETIDNQRAGFESGLFGLIRDMVISPNGQHLYTAASGDQAIMSFTRNNADGTLALNQTVENNLTADFGIDGVYALSMSPDGQFLYAAGSESNAIGVFSVNENDGTLSYIEKEVLGVNDPNDTGGEVTFMERPIDVHVTADGTQVLVAADFSSSLVVFDRDSETGELNFSTAFKKGVNGVQGLGGASSIWSSLDNRHVYIMGRGDDSVTVFDRSPTGNLSFNASLTQQQADFIGLDAPLAVVGSPDDSRLYGLGFDDSSMVSFRRINAASNPQYGQLIFADIEQDNVNGINSLAGPIALDVSSDGKWVIVAAGIDNALTLFKTHLNDLIFSNGFD
ncbi:beta-propeller fold lactonase family protein [Marinicella sp. S1101]|uniref:beta-propeller fold lactonase family protein n=1 Tax=Marinicella marina TaxID=2996016 RepID=UPI002260CC59|nr:beta-propeller fold lactonase family protein [Marinicella marina]MCX7554067.1 beta-propeller fold lactonase family protein [Marinicella marina]MDJ1141240.1 beta-propeller fold lactonase family protein [Marinicella marina]